MDKKGKDKIKSDNPETKHLDMHLDKHKNM